jgi:hypothetical protein
VCVCDSTGEPELFFFLVAHPPPSALPFATRSLPSLQKNTQPPTTQKLPSIVPKEYATPAAGGAAIREAYTRFAVAGK